MQAWQAAPLRQDFGLALGAVGFAMGRVGGCRALPGTAGGLREHWDAGPPNVHTSTHRTGETPNDPSAAVGRNLN